MNPNCYTENTLTMTNLYGENVSTTLTGNVGDYVLNKSDFGLELVDRISDGIQVGSINNLRTVSMWVKILSTSTHSNYLLDARTGDNEGYIVEGPSDQIGTLWLDCTYYLNGVSGLFDILAMESVMDHNDSWRHIVLIANRTFTDDLTILSRFHNVYDETPYCRVGPVKLFNRVLNEEEILSLYNEFAPRYNKTII